MSNIPAKNISSRSSSYRHEIDGLRAFAVTVIINHFNKEILPYGYLGVDIFFVISDSLLHHLFIKDRVKTSRISSVDFMNAESSD